MKEFLANFPFTKVNVFLVIAVSFCYNILLDRDVGCTCQDVALHCYVYMLLPCAVFTFLMLWTDKTCHQASRYTFACQIDCGGNGCRSSFWGFLGVRVFRAVCVGLLWVISLLIDGDWYLCCANHQSDQQKQLACLKKENMTAKEERDIHGLKNYSRLIGCFLLLVIMFLGAVTSMCDWKRCCGKNSRLLYDKLVLKEGHKELKKTLREAAKGELTASYLSSIHGNRWTECLGFAEELIESSNNPKLSKQQKTELEEGNGTIRAELHHVPQQQGPARDQLQPGEGPPGQREPAERPPGQQEPGEEHPGQWEPGEEHPGQWEPGEGPPGQQEPGEEHPGQWEPGEEHPGQREPREEHPGQWEPGEEHPGQWEPGEEHPGQREPGEEHPGQWEPGEEHPGQWEPGEEHPGQREPVEEHPGHQKPSKKHQGQREPGEEHLGQQKPREGPPGQRESGEEHPGQQKPREEHPGQREAGEEHLGQEKPSKEPPGQREPREEHPGQREAGEEHLGQREPREEHPGQPEPGEGPPGQQEPEEEHPGQQKPSKKHPGQWEVEEEHLGQQKPSKTHLGQHQPREEHLSRHIY